MESHTRDFVLRTTTTQWVKMKKKTGVVQKKPKPFRKRKKKTSCKKYVSEWLYVVCACRYDVIIIMVIRNQLKLTDDAALMIKR